MSQLNYDKYIDLLESGKNSEAAKYKISCIPNRLFKYVSLKNGKDLLKGDRELNDKKITTLRENRIHMDKLSSYNDPFEGAFFILDKNKLEEFGWKGDNVQNILDFLTVNWTVCSLAATGYENMPMWAYYANNHQGFCIEYRFTDKQKKYILPVAYEDKRRCVNGLITNLIAEEYKLARNAKGAESLSINSQMANVFLYLSMAVKHKSWAHEKEYRIIDVNGRSDFPAMASNVYIGMNCSDENKDKICDAVDKIDFCHAYQMKFIRNEEKFELAKELLI